MLSDKPPTLPPDVPAPGTPAIIISAISGNTTEGAGSASFTVRLNSQPAATVSIALNSSNTAEGIVSPTMITFTPVNWSTNQTVTVTGVDDLNADGNIAYTIVTAAAVSTDGAYNGMNAADISVINVDNDTPGITVFVNSATTTEAGGTATFTVVLNTQPSASNTVSINLSSDNTAEGTVAPTSLTFTTANWSTPQTVTATGINDLVQDGNIAYNIITSAAISGDVNYNGMSVADVAMTNNDNDAAGITVSAISGPTTEAGGTATFTVVLNSQPSASNTVSINLSSSNTAEGTVFPANVTFTTGNWSTPQTVTVTGVNDAVQDGNAVYSIVTAAATSGDANYNGMNPNDVSVTNTDNDTAGILVSAISGATTEAGGQATFTIVLNTQPSASNTVSVALTSSNTAEGTVSPSSITFTTGNWNTPQTVTVTGVNDAVQDGNIVYSIVTAAATSGDANYNGLNPTDVAVTNNDNDTAGFTISTISGATTEAGGQATFTIVLNTQPSASNTVSVALTSSNTAEGTVSPSSVIFTTGNWNTPQTVTITGVDDAVIDGNIAYSIVTAAATSGDTNYNTMNPPDIAVTNNDNDVAGTAPTVVLTTPSAADVSAPTNTKVAVSFSLAMNTASITTNTANGNCSGSVQISTAANNFAAGTCIQMSGVPVASLGNTVFTLTPSSNLAAATVYLIRVTTAVASAGATPMATNYNTTFSTGSGADTVAPPIYWSIGFSSPYDTETNVPVNTNVSVLYIESMLTSTFTTNTADNNCTGSLQLSTVANNFAAGTCIQMQSQPGASADGKSFTIRPLANLAPLTQYSVKITNAVTDLAGNAPATSTITFTTGAAAKSTAVAVNGYGPTEGTTNVGINPALTVAFDAPIDPTTIILNTTDSICSGSIQISANGVFTTCVKLQPKYLFSETYSQLDFYVDTPLAYGTNYRIRTTSQIKDIYGNTLNPNPTTQATGFTTIAATGIATTVDRLIPIDGTAGNSVTTAFSVVFTRTMNPATITVNTTDNACTGSFLFSTSANNFGSNLCLRMSGGLTPSVGNTQFTVHPFAVLTSGVTYKTRVTTAAQDTNANPIGAQYNGSGITTIP